VTGAAGGVVGGSVAGQFCPAAVEGWVASGIAGGAAAGAVQGGYAGYQTGGWGGVAGGALNGALTGGAIGGVGALAAYGAFNSLGLLDGYTCFVDGTLVHGTRWQRPIEDVVLGRRAATPWTKDQSWSGDGDLGVIDTTNLRAVKLRLVKRGHRNGQIDIALLRHTSWLRENNAREGGVIRLVLKEMHVDDDVEVMSVEPCPEIERGGGQLVTGTFSHKAEDVLNVKLVGFDQPLGVTSQHRIFELDGEAFLEAAKLLVGQHLLTKTGDVAIESIEMRAGSFRVRNIEVEYEHVYYASEAGVLVHNIYTPENAAEELPIGMSEISEDFPYGEHELAASKGYTGIGRTVEGGPDFEESDYLYPAEDGQSSSVKIQLTGSRTQDYLLAEAASEIGETPDGYVWHHVDDYDPITGEATLQLVEEGAHVATTPHSGSVAQYEAANNVTYKS
jgi:hypothetical protein